MRFPKGRRAPKNPAGELIEARIVYTRLGSEMFPGIGGDEEDEGEEDGE